MCDQCEWSENLSKIEGMLDDTTYRKGHQFLEDVYSWVEDNEHITERQKEVVNQIEESV